MPNAQARQQSDMEAVVQKLQSSKQVLVLTGAGVSVGSGLPTYRGLGSPSDPVARQAMHAHSWHLPEIYPQVRQHWEQLRSRLDDAEPCAAHRALTKIQRHVLSRGASLRILTQNIDGLHQRSGSEDVLELHGSLMRTIVVDTPCGPLRRPDAVFFGEQIRHREEVVELVAEASLLLVVGSSGTVHPVAGIPAQARARTIRADGIPYPRAVTALIDPVAWPDAGMHHFDHHLAMTADEALSAIADALDSAATTDPARH